MATCLSYKSNFSLLEVENITHLIKYYLCNYEKSFQNNIDSVIFCVLAENLVYVG